MSGVNGLNRDVLGIILRLVKDDQAIYQPIGRVRIDSRPICNR